MRVYVPSRTTVPAIEVGVRRSIRSQGRRPLLLWLGETIRPTKDVDLLGFGDTSAGALKHVFVSLCAIDAPEDGLTFLPESVHVEAIREGQEYGGMRVKLLVILGNVRIPLQVDVGAGDAVVPPPEVLEYLYIKEMALATRLVDIEELRQLCTDQGCYDQANFTANFRRDVDAGLLREQGDKNARTRRYMLTQKGVAAGAELLTELVQQ